MSLAAEWDGAGSLAMLPNSNEAAQVPSTGALIQVDDPVPAFAQKWSLNAGAVQWLYSLEPGVRATVISQFAPRCDTKDTLRMLYGFGRSIAARAGGGGGQFLEAVPGMPAPAPTQALSVHGNSHGAAAPLASVESFAERFGLDSGAIGWLYTLDEKIRNTVVAEFSPGQCDPAEATRMLYAFGKSVAQRYAAGGAMPSELRAFAQRWGLDAAGLSWLLSLPPNVQGVVVREFSPREGVLDVMGKLRAFARSVESRSVGGFAPAGAHPAGPPAAHHPAPLPAALHAAGPPGGPSRRVQEFIAYWSLDDGAQALLISLPLEVQVRVVDQFDPRGEVANISRKFMAFAKLALRQAPAPPPADPLLDSFAAHWALSEEAKEYLRALPVEVRTEVINRFDPAGPTKDINRKLTSFARSVATVRLGSAPAVPGAPAGPGVTWGPPPAAAAVQACGAAALVRPPQAAPLHPQGAPAQAALPQGPPRTGQPEEEAFLAHWGLDGIPTARDILQRLLPDVRAHVMREFNPKAGTRDILRLFIGFANSVARKFVDETGLSGHQPAATPMAPPAGVAPQAWQPSAPMSAEEFAQRWQLDEGSKALLRGLPEAARLRVIAEFNPRGPVLDVGGKFCSFARSVASAVAAEQAGNMAPRGLKRPAEWPPEVGILS